MKHKIAQMTSDVGTLRIESTHESGKHEVSLDEYLGGETPTVTPKMTTTPTVTTKGTASGATADLDQANPITDSKMGVNLSEQVITTKIKPLDGMAVNKDDRAQAHLNEPGWSLETMLKRNNLVTSFKWSLTDARGVKLAMLDTMKALDVPLDLLQNSISSAPFERFVKCKFRKLTVHVQLTASRYHEGALMFYYVPSMRRKEDYSDLYSIVRATGLQHVILNPAAASVADLEIPFIYNKGYIDLEFGDSLGQISCVVLNQLQVATGGDTSVEVKMFVSIEGAEFKIPRPGGTTFRSTMHAINEQVNEIKDMPESLEKERRAKALDDEIVLLKTRLNDAVKIRSKHESGKYTFEEVDLKFKSLSFEKSLYYWRTMRHLTGAPLSKALDALMLETPSPQKLLVMGYDLFHNDDTGETIAIPKVEKKSHEYPVTRREEAIHEMFSHIGSALGEIVDEAVPNIIKDAFEICLDKPGTGEIPPPVVRKDQGYLSNNKGIEFLEKVTLDPAAQTLTTNQVGSEKDELNFEYLMRKEMLLTTVNWKATDPVGKTLFSIDVSPGHIIAFDSNNFSATIPFDIQGCVFPALFTTFWRGGFKFRFQVVMSAFHEGRLGVTNHPTEDTLPPTYKAVTTQYYESHTVRNVSNEWTNIVPFLSDTPYKLIWQGQPLSSVQSDKAVRYEDYSLGKLGLCVDATLKASSGSPNNVDINIWISAADDLEYHTFSPFTIPARPYGTFRNIEEDDTESSIIVVSADHESGKRDSASSKSSAAALHNTAKKDDEGATPLAVTKAQTYDLKVPHFGETYNTFRELCKRYSLYDTGTVTATKARTITEIPIALHEMGGVFT